MEIAVKYQNVEADNKGSDKLEVTDSVFAVDYKEGLVHQVINSYLAGMRQGTHKTLNRAEKSYSKKKLWRQKRYWSC